MRGLSRRFLAIAEKRAYVSRTFGVSYLLR
jgi:hypothetical protein